MLDPSLDIVVIGKYAWGHRRVRRHHCPEFGVTSTQLPVIVTPDVGLRCKR